MQFSVIIPTYNRREGLLRCLEALCSQTMSPADFEVVVVDDGSSDGTAEVVAAKNFSFPLRLIPTENGGAGRARNIGAAQGRGDYLAFTEDDAVPDREWLSRAAAALAASPGTEVLEGKTVYENTGESVRRLDQPGIPSFIPCNLFISKRVFDDAGGYDPAFFDPVGHLYFREDADLGFTLLERGARAGFAEDVIVTHPAQFSGVRDAFRHARRYRFDALLYRKHPLLFRRMIEVKRIAGLRLRRLHHLVGLLYGGALVWLALAALLVPGPFWILPAALLVLCGLLFRFKYQGRRALALYRIGETVGFLFLPAVYLWTILRGAIRYRSFGSLLP